MTELTESRYKSPCEYPLIDVSIGELFDSTARRFGIAECLNFPEEELQLTFIKAKNEVDKIAASLIALGLTQNDRVALWGANHSNLLLSIFACAKIGVVFTIINSHLNEEALEQQLLAMDISLIICFPTVKRGRCNEVLTKICPELETCSRGKLKSEKLPKLTHVVMEEGDFCGTYSWSEFIGCANETSIAKLPEIAKSVKSDSVAAFMITSGTTGNPKFAQLTHFQLINGCLVAGKRLYLDRKGEILCCPVPLFRGPVMCLAALAPAVFGVKCVYPSPLPLPPTIFKCLQDYNCTCVISNPIAFHLLLRLAINKKIHLDHLTSVCLGGDHVPVDLVEAISKATEIKDVCVGMYLTESGCLPAFMPKDGIGEKLLSTVGKIAEGFEVEIADSEGQITPVAKPGEMRIRPVGGTKFLGYVGDKSDPSDWVETGDIASMDKDGYISILCQKDEVIVRNKKPIYPATMEKLLSSHRSVLGVQVVGYAIGDENEKICACVVVKDKQDETIKSALKLELLEHCKEENLEQPDYILFVDDFPRTPTRKVQKFKLKQLVPQLIKEQC